ncbi:hypothetical protein V6N12_028332 [Hibiscus sabdariffa]|uniref:Uncharacterized protein n=1 Tax=Hibiscus sabdariffa TaxID=183260 RepID=A0ABR2F5M2_9ROSI
MIVEDAAFCRGFLPTGSAAAELLSSFSLVLKLPLVLFGPVQSPLAQASVKTGLSDAISRANLYMEVFLLHAPCISCNLHLTSCIFGVTPLHTPEEHKALGFHLIVHPLTALYASARALVVVLETLNENKDYKRSSPQE